MCGFFFFFWGARTRFSFLALQPKEVTVIIFVAATGLIDISFNCMTNQSVNARTFLIGLTAEVYLFNILRCGESSSR